MTKLYQPKKECPEERALRLLRDAQSDPDPDFNFEKLIKGLKYTGEERKHAVKLVESFAVRDIKYLELCDALIDLILNGVPDPKEYAFVGTCLPAFHAVGNLIGATLEVYNSKNEKELKDAVPFLRDYILYYEPKAMPQLMRYVRGEINDIYLLKHPFHEDNTIEYKSKAFKNTVKTAHILTLYCETIGLVPPQDVLYNSGLKVGDKIFMLCVDKWEYKKVYEIENNCVIINRNCTLTKYDKWIQVV